MLTNTCVALSSTGRTEFCLVCFGFILVPTGCFGITSGGDISGQILDVELWRPIRVGFRFRVFFCYVLLGIDHFGRRCLVFGDVGFGDRPVLGSIGRESIVRERFFCSRVSR